jgi:F-type H+-transporting ATPase subunit b
MFLRPDGTFWFQLINFAIFFAILYAVFLRPVGDAIIKRRAYIESVQTDYTKAVEEAKTARAEAEQKRGSARRQADETVSAARAAGEAEAAAIVSDHTVEAQSIGDLARATVATEAAAARLKSEELAHSLAKTLVERAVGGGS